MITNIHIDNYALIDRISVSLDGGLTVITGETGAGKSILLGAIGLTLGQRADASVLADPARKCLVEVTYAVSDYQLQPWFAANDLDWEAEVTVRREIRADGRSRAFVNDTPVNNRQLKELGGYLVDIHSQNHSQLIGRTDYQLEVLDAFCGAGETLAAYRTHYHRYRKEQALLNEWKERQAKATEEEDYLKFQFTQLESASLREGEQEELEEELARLTNAGMIQSVFTTLLHALDGEEQSVMPRLRTEKNRVAGLTGVVREAGEYVQRLQSILLELEDLGDEADRQAEKAECSPQRLRWVEERLNTLYELQRKHRKETVAELIALQESFRQSLEQGVSLSESIEEQERKLLLLEDELRECAGRLHGLRLTGKETLEKEIERLLVDLGIRHARFVVEVEAVDQPHEEGMDRVLFRFSANKNQEPGELSQVASGGEISRIMLSLKYILSNNRQLPTILFDEIDTGVSGEIAHRMAMMLTNMALRMQVVAITHLPQLAAAGNTHYKVYKTEEEAHTATRIRPLSREERINEIAGMISGSHITDIALQNARQLLDNESADNF